MTHVTDPTPEDQMKTATAYERPVTPQKMPWFALSLLTMIGFVLITAETMPAGLLPVMASDLDVSEGTVGQFISVWALGTVIVTIPAISLTRNLRRKPLLLAAILGLLLSNSVTAVSTNVPLTLVARFVSGAATGIIWSMTAVYGRRISPPRRAGLALAIVSTGAPIGFALGTPLGAWVGTTFGWRWSFAGISTVTLVVLVLMVAFLPVAHHVAASTARTRLPLRRVFLVSGIPIVLAVTASWSLAHSTIYTYIAPYLRATGTDLRPDFVLLVYGIASIAGLVVTAICIDRFPRALLHTSVAVFAGAAAVLLVAHDSAPAVLVATGLWGATFGGAPAQLQSALTISAGQQADVANAFLPVAFNVAIFLAGIVGALLLGQFDGLVLAAAMIVLGVLALAFTVIGRRSAFAART